MHFCRNVLQWFQLLHVQNQVFWVRCLFDSFDLNIGKCCWKLKTWKILRSNGFYDYVKIEKFHNEWVNEKYWKICNRYKYLFVVFFFKFLRFLMNKNVIALTNFVKLIPNNIDLIWCYVNFHFSKPNKTYIPYNHTSLYGYICTIWKRKGKLNQIQSSFYDIEKNIRWKTVEKGQKFKGTQKEKR